VEVRSKTHQFTLPPPIHKEPAKAKETQMPADLTQVRNIFKNLATGDGTQFFTHVADDINWIVEGTHPLAGHYHSKADFPAHTFEKLDKVLPQGAELYEEHALASDAWAAVELHSLATAKNGLKFAYLDSALVARLFEENPISEIKRTSGATA